MTVYIFSMLLHRLLAFYALVLQIWCHSFTKDVPHWLPQLLIILSNDIQLKPGPQFQDNFLNFMSWNLNWLTKGNFERARLWWPDGDTTPEGTEIDDLLTLLGLSQLISERANFEAHKEPSCIDLVITN